MLIFDWVNIAQFEFLLLNLFSIFVSCLSLLYCLVCFLQLCDHMLGTDLLSPLSVIFLVFLSLSHMVSQVLLDFSITVKLYYSYLGVVRLFHLLRKGNQVLFIVW